MKTFARVALTAFFITYPLLVWLGIRGGQPEWIALLLAAAAVIQVWVKRTRFALAAAAAALGLAAAAWTAGSFVPVKFYPVVMNAAWLAYFGFSLTGTPAVERFARLRRLELPAHAVHYCRQVTRVWCVFFMLNGLVALDSAVNRSDDWWALYNGLISYGLIVLMFACEFVVRLMVDQRYKNSHD